MTSPRSPMLLLCRGVTLVLLAAFAALLAAPLLAIVSLSEGPSFRSWSWDPVARSLWTSAVAAAVASVAAIAFAVDRLHGSQRIGGPTSRLSCLAGALVDLPIALPPVVLGLSLLAIFRGPLAGVDRLLAVVGSPAAIILAQLSIGVPLCCRMTSEALDRVPRRLIDAERTLGGPPHRVAVVALVESRAAVAAAALIGWAAMFGAFGPVLLFAGVTEGRTEILPTKVYLDVAGGDLAAAAAAALLMSLTAAAVAFAARRLSAGGP